MQWRVYGRLPYAPGLKPPAPPEQEVHLVDSTYIASGAATSTTQRLTGLTGTFTAGRISDDTNPLPSIDIGNDGNTEVEFCVKIAASVTDGTQFKFRITDNGTPLDTYTITPVVTVSTSGALAPPVGLRAATLAPDPDIEYAAREWRQAEIEFVPQWRETPQETQSDLATAFIRVAGAQQSATLTATDDAGRAVVAGQPQSATLSAADGAGRILSSGQPQSASVSASNQAGVVLVVGQEQSASTSTVVDLGTARIQVSQQQQSATLQAQNEPGRVPVSGQQQSSSLSTQHKAAVILVTGQEQSASITQGADLSTASLSVIGQQQQSSASTAEDAGRIVFAGQQQQSSASAGEDAGRVVVTGQQQQSSTSVFEDAGRIVVTGQEQSASITQSADLSTAILSVVGQEQTATIAPTGIDLGTAFILVRGQAQSATISVASNAGNILFAGQQQSASIEQKVDLGSGAIEVVGQQNSATTGASNGGANLLVSGQPQSSTHSIQVGNAGAEQAPGQPQSSTANATANAGRIVVRGGDIYVTQSVSGSADLETAVILVAGQKQSADITQPVDPKLIGGRRRKYQNVEFRPIQARKRRKKEEERGQAEDPKAKVPGTGIGSIPQIGDGIGVVDIPEETREEQKPAVRPKAKPAASAQKVRKPGPDEGREPEEPDAVPQEPQPPRPELPPKVEIDLEQIKREVAAEVRAAMAAVDEVNSALAELRAQLEQEKKRRSELERELVRQRNNRVAIEMAISKLLDGEDVD
jgi:hypothetical protein